MTQRDRLITNMHTAPEDASLDGDHWGGAWRVLTPHMRERGGRLGVAWNRVPPGRAGCPFHTHRLEDEVFLVLSGHGVLRYGEHIFEIGPGDCISCPAGGQEGHQLANTHATEDLVYLSIGPHEPEEVCTYPDTGKIMVRSLAKVGWLQRTPYMAGERERPKIFDMADARTDET